MVVGVVVDVVVVVVFVVVVVVFVGVHGFESLLKIGEGWVNSVDG
jgi:hypothetical protein